LSTQRRVTPRIHRPDNAKRRAEVPDVREVLLHRDVVDPGLQLRVEELLPLVAHVEHHGAAEEEMLEAEAGCHAAEVEQIPGKRRPGSPLLSGGVARCFMAIFNLKRSHMLSPIEFGLLVSAVVDQWDLFGWGSPECVLRDRNNMGS